MRLPTPIERAASAWIARVQRHPWLVLSLITLLTLAAAAGLPRLTLRMDGRAMVPADDPAVDLDQLVRDRFGVRDQLVILLESRRPEGIYHAAFLRTLADVTEAVRGLPGVPDEHIVSLANQRRDRVYPGTLKFRPFLDPFPDTPALLERLKEDIAAAGILLDGTLVSHDQRAAAVFVGVPGVEQIGDRSPLYRQVVERVMPLADAETTISVVGAPAAEALLGHHIMDDMALLLPLSIASMALLLFWRLGRLWGVILGLLEVGACLLATFGVMGWAGAPVSLTSGVLPLVLVSLCLADEIHLFTHYQRLLGAAAAPATGDDPIGRAFADMLPPILVTSLTTSIGFSSFLISPIGPIRQFGASAAFGILYGLLFSVTAIPAALTLLPAARLRPAARGAGGDRLLRPIEAAIGRPRPTLTASIVVAVVLALGIGNLVVQDGWIDGFAPDSPFRRDTERVNELLLGTHNLLIHLTVDGDGAPPAGDGREGWLLDPALLAEIGRFEEALRAMPEVGGVLGPYSHLSTVSFLWHARKGSPSIPDDVVKVARVVRFFDIVRGPHERRKVLTDSLDEALITVFLKRANYQQTRALIERMMASTSFTSHRVELATAGDVAVSQAMIPAIVRSQVSSLMLALGGAFLALLLLLRSPSTALVTILPATAAVACVFGVMGWLGIPLGVATSMFCAITLGVGVDYAIHFVAARQRALARGASDSARAALRESGPAILTDFAVIALSFAWLALSQVPSNQRLGLMVALALGLSCAFTLLGLGSIGRRAAAQG